MVTAASGATTEAEIGTDSFAEPDLLSVDLASEELLDRGMIDLARAADDAVGAAKRENIEPAATRGLLRLTGANADFVGDPLDTPAVLFDRFKSIDVVLLTGRSVDDARAGRLEGCAKEFGIDSLVED